MGIIGFVIVGLIAGFIARALVPGPDPMGWLGTFILKDQAVRRDPELPESILHQPLFTVWRRAHQLAEAAVRSKSHFDARAELDRRPATHLVGRVAAATRPSSRRRMYSPNIGSTK